MCVSACAGGMGWEEGVATRGPAWLEKRHMIGTGNTSLSGYYKSM